MKRPLVLVGFSYLLTLAAAVYFGAKLSIPFACLCLLGFLLTMLIPKTRVVGVFPLAFLTMSLAFGSFYIYNISAIAPSAALAEKDAVITGTVCELPYQAYNRFYYVVEVKELSISNAPKTMKIRLSSQNALNVEPYSQIKARVHFFLPKGGEGYSSRSYYASKGITLFAYLYEYDPVHVTPPSQKPLYYYALRLRKTLLKSVRSMLPPDEAALVNGVLFGDTASLSAQVNNDFKTIGISHILSVSGLHMTTMAQLLMLLLLFLKIPKKPAAAVAGIGVVCFMAVTCFVPSVVRSGIMCLLYLAGIVFSRRPDSLNSLCAAVLLIGIVNPYAAADIGLLLSFSATLGLILLSAPVSRYLNLKTDKIKAISPLVRGVNGIIGTTIGAVLFTLPIIIVSFGNVSLIAPVSNLLELVPSTLMMNFAAIASVLNLIAPYSYLAMPFALAAGLLAKYMQACAHWLAQIPYASISASYGFVRIWLAGTILLFAATFLMMKTKQLLKISAWLSAILLLTGIFSYQLSVQNVTRLAILDVGTAQAAVLTRNGHAAVIGCGGFSSVPIRNYLHEHGITQLDCIQLLTSQSEESKNAADLIKEFAPKHLVMKDDDCLDGFLEKEVSRVKKLSYYQESASIDLWSSVELALYSAGAASAARVTVNQTTILISPDGVKLQALPNDWLDSDFVAVSSLSEDMKLSNPAYLFLSMDEQDFLKSASKAKGYPIIVTGGTGNIVLEMKENRTLNIRRE